MKTALQYQVIDKEAISALSFPEKEVLSDKSAIDLRLKDLNRALTLGNLERSKIKIFFYDSSDTMKMVETTVWGLTDKRVILKQGITIPIHRVAEVKF